MLLLLKTMLFLSFSIIVAGITWLSINKWQKKHDETEACFCEKTIKFIVKCMWCGIGGLIVSGLFLLLHIY